MLCNKVIHICRIKLLLRPGYSLSLPLTINRLYLSFVCSYRPVCGQLQEKTPKIEITTALHGTICLSLLYSNYVVLLKDSVLHLQEEMNRLQENLEKLKVQGSEDDSEEKVT